MKLKLKKGASYLVETKTANSHRFWLVQQTGQRSWVATQFTECITDHDGSYSVILGNSLKVVEELTKLSYSQDIQFRAVRNTPYMRKQMFSILQYGKFVEGD